MRRRLTLVVPTLAFGGAERVLARMANHWSACGDAITVITLSDGTKDTYTLDPGVTRVALGMMSESRGAIQAVVANLERINHLRAAILRSEPHTVIGFTDRMNVLTALACRPLGIDTVISERIDPSCQPIGRVWGWLRRRGYPSARALVVQTERVRQQMEPVMRGKPIYVIPNAVDVPAERAVARKSADCGARWIVGMGRLTSQKGFDLLIEAFSRVASRHPQWRLQILGEGPDRNALGELARARGMADRVHLMGWQPDPAAVLAGSDLFVLSSRFEGFPNALLEAMAGGLPAISFDCPSGPAEIIRDGVDGLLVPPGDIAALATRLEQLMTDDELRERLGAEAARVCERFSPARYYAEWEAVLRKEPPDSPRS